MKTARILIISGTSMIAEQCARILAEDGAAIFLTGRNADRLQAIADDIRVRGSCRVSTEQFDITDTIALNGIVNRASEALGGLDSVIFAAGQLPDQGRVKAEPELLRQTVEINATGAMVVLDQAALFFEQQGRGQIVAIGSVAGDRGRAVNYAYGAAKSALEVFMSGLGQRLHGKGVQVLLVKPGFVDTPMTAGFDKGPLWASPHRVARDIVKGMKQHRGVIYTPWFWRWIMLVIRFIPEPIFRRLRF